MSLRRRLTIIFCCAGANLFPLSAARAEAPLVIPGRYLVKRSAVSAAKHIRAELLSLPSGRRRPARYHRRDNKCREILKNNPGLSACSPDFVISTADSDPYSFQCTEASNCSWARENTFDTDLDLPAAWSITEGSPDILVAVLDTGVDLTHPDLQGNLWVNPGEIAGNGQDDDGNGYVDDIHGVNVDTNGPPQDDNGHGTHVSGIIAAVRDNGLGIAGAAPKVKIIAVKILDEDGSGTVALAIKGVDYVTDLASKRSIPVVIFNNSWGGFIPLNEIDPLREAFERAGQAGLLATAAAGNGGRDGIGDNIDQLDYFPAKFSNLPNVITVAASTITGRLAGFSNFGPNSVHLAAAGQDIRSLLASGTGFGGAEENGTSVTSGTSMATPFVSGVLALIRSQFPALSQAEVKDRLLSRTYSLPEPDNALVITGGRLNAFYAVTEGAIPLPTPLPTSIFTATPTRTPTRTATPTATVTATNTVITPPESTPTATVTPTLETASIAPQFSIRAAPLKQFAARSAETFLSAKEGNLIQAAASGLQDLSGIKLSLASGACKLTEAGFKRPSPFFTLELKGEAKRLKNIGFTIASADTVYLSRNVPVIGAKKGALKLSCKQLAKKVRLKSH